MNASRSIKHLALLLCLFFIGRTFSQCGSCNITFTDNSVSAYTVTTAQKLCIAGDLTYTGTLTLNGGTICNNGIIEHIIFKKGVFNNNLTGIVNAGSTAAMQFKLGGKVILNNYTGAQVILDDSLNIYSNSNDSLIINVYEGSSVNCNSLNHNSGNFFLNDGLAAITIVDSSFITSFNVNGNAILTGNTFFSIDYPGNFNVNGQLIFPDGQVRRVDNSGMLYVADTLLMEGSSGGSACVALNNYGECTVFKSLHSTLSNGKVRINNHVGLSTGLLYVDEDLNTLDTATRVMNEGAMQVNGNINIIRGNLSNTGLIEGGKLFIDSATVTNDALLFLAGDLEVNDVDAVLNQNSKTMVGGEFGNYGVVNMGDSSVIAADRFDNRSGATINGSPESGPRDYARIFINGVSNNSGSLIGNIRVIDLSPSNAYPSMDSYGDGAYQDPNVLNGITCNDNLDMGILYAFTGDGLTSASPLPRTVFCPGENVIITFLPYAPIAAGFNWTVEPTGGEASNSTSGYNINLSNIMTGGLITISGAYFNGFENCMFSLSFSISVGNGSIAVTSPVYFGVGNQALLTTTVTVGTPPISYTWTPDYFFAPGNTVNGPSKTVIPKVSLIYTVNMVDGHGCTASNTIEVIGEPFAALDKELNGEYYKLMDNKLYFKYEGQYDSGNLSYVVYDKNHSVIASPISNNLLNITTVVPGDNRLTLDAGSLSSGYYVLELTNEKNEKTFLRFKK